MFLHKNNEIVTLARVIKQNLFIYNYIRCNVTIWSFLVPKLVRNAQNEIVTLEANVTIFLGARCRPPGRARWPAAVRLA